MALKYVTASKPSSYSAPENTSSYSAPTYTSEYSDQLKTALNNVTNFSYDPLKDSNYTALAKVYNQQGKQAANDTMGQAAALNGGYGSSYATTAAAQQRSNYNQQLASMIPDLEDRAYTRATGTLSALQTAEDSNYNKYRDQVSDAQWQYSQDYQNWRDQVSDAQWQYSTDNSNYQWAKDYNLDLYSTKKANSSSSSSSSGSGSGGSSTSSDVVVSKDWYDTANNLIETENTKNAVKSAVYGIFNNFTPKGKKKTTK